MLPLWKWRLRLWNLAREILMTAEFSDTHTCVHTLTKKKSVLFNCTISFNLFVFEFFLSFLSFWFCTRISRALKSFSRQYCPYASWQPLQLSRQSKTLHCTSKRKTTNLCCSFDSNVSPQIKMMFTVQILHEEMQYCPLKICLSP